MGNEENPPEKGSAGKSATMAGVAVAMIGLCSIVAKGVFDHFDDIKLLLSPKVTAQSSPSPGRKNEQPPLASPIESPDRSHDGQTSFSTPASQTEHRDSPVPLRSPIHGQEQVLSDENHGPVAIVQGYYDALNRHSLSGAYDRLSTGFRARRPLQEFSKIFTETSAITVKQINEAARSTDAATVFIQFVEIDSDHREQKWEGNVYLLREPVGWRIERTKLERL